ncbi:MAG TPA: hypothetical protein VGQ81_02715 [Acidobacteriota bacterium]|nr:hypothetical protein [Acidobacteriota bacterium]
MKRASLLAFSIIFLVAATTGEKQLYPNRWLRLSSNLRDDREIERIRGITRTASEHGFTGIALSAGLDQLDLKPPDYFRRLQEVRRICDHYKLDIIPSFMSAGYGGAVLAHDKNLAAGLPVRDALFVVGQGKARLVPDPEVKITNGGFESSHGGQVDEFRATRQPDMGSLDTQVFEEGKSSLRFENFGKYPKEWVSISQQVKVHPFRCYRLSCWVKSENMGASEPFGSGNFQLQVLGGDEKRPLQYENPRVSGNEDWHKVAVAFNSWGYDSVEIAPRVRGASGGKFWLDDLRLEEVGLVNMLRRPGTPLKIRSEAKGSEYVEGHDFAPVSDPQLNFRFDHEEPEIRIPAGSRIQEGVRLRVSYYHGTSIYNGQTPLCMSEPKLYEIWRTQARLVHQALAPKKYLLNMDEIRTGGSCEACRRRGMTLGQILGDCITKQFKMLREVNPQAEVFVWSDMLDPNHNANPSHRYYYLAEGDFVGSWQYIPKELIIVCWHYDKRNPSLRHFSSLGFRTMAGAYYDADNLDNPKGWLEALDATPGATGIMYTTWLNKYDLLAPFGDLVSRRN